MIIDPNDKAAVVLYGEPTINDEQRADLYDVYYQSPTANALACRLAPLDLHPDLKEQLVNAKRLGEDAMDRAIEAINKLRQIDPVVLAKAERHPTITQALILAGNK
jgi:hypothetical protein